MRNAPPRRLEQTTRRPNVASKELVRDRLRFAEISDL